MKYSMLFLIDLSFMLCELYHMLRPWHFLQECSSLLWFCIFFFSFHPKFHITMNINLKNRCLSKLYIFLSPFTTALNFWNNSYKQQKQLLQMTNGKQHAQLKDFTSGTKIEIMSMTLGGFELPSSITEVFHTVSHS